MRNTGFVIIILALLVGCSAEKKATRAFRLGKYQTTIDLYKERLAKNPNDGVANYLVAESYRLSNRIKDAEPFYARAGGRGVDADSVKFYHGQALEINGKYSEAKKVWQELGRESRNETRPRPERRRRAIPRYRCETRTAIPPISSP